MHARDRQVIRAELFIPKAHVPFMLLSDQGYMRLYTIAMTNTVLDIAAFEFSLQMQDELVTPCEFEFTADESHMRIVVPDVGNMVPDHWKEVLPKEIFGRIEYKKLTFRIIFSLA